jgi:hypothetical protein
MNWITAPSRAFGVGETKSQNAVIKVYSAAELKAALTKVYQLVNGVGTIEIAGDIIITDPIRLKQFNNTDSQPREIIIQAVAGARIINGRKTENDAAYFYNQTNNTNIPVFDFGKALGYETGTFVATSLSNCKYTFKDLHINTPNSKPFGAIIAGDTYGVGGFIATTSLISTKAYNVWNIYAAYDTTGATDRFLSSINNKVDDFKYTNNPGNLITETSLNNATFGSSNGLYINIGVYNLSTFVLYTSTQRFRIYNNIQFENNSISSIAQSAQITTGVSALGVPQIGYGNTISGCSLFASPFDTAFAYINCTINGAINTVIPTNNASSANANIAEARVTNAGGAFLENTQATNATYCQYTNGAGTLIRVDGLPVSSYYEIDWILSVKYQVSGLVNNYHLKSSVRVDGAGVGTVVSNSTIYATEEVIGTLIGIIPYWDGLNNTFAIAPQDSTPLKILATCTIILNGLRLPAA